MPHYAQVLPGNQYGAALRIAKIYQSTRVLALPELSNVLGGHSEAIYQGSRLPRWKNTADFPT